MKKLSAFLLTTIILFSSCNGEPPPAQTPEPPEEPVVAVEVVVEPEEEPVNLEPPPPTTESVVVEGVEDVPKDTSEENDLRDRLINAGRHHLKIFELFGYRIDEEGDIFINSADWTPTTHEQYEEYFFGTWESYMGNPYVIDSIPPDDSRLYMAGDKAIVWIYPDNRFDDYWHISWIEFSNLDEIIYSAANEFLENEIRLHNIIAYDVGGIIMWQLFRIT